ncbi:unnamed protein product [Orchesella dallaii]|uniref:Uncharacterized protein n=1 Tax=Orchesella dallaii TaxID=48710 RepID=A0ABP1Q4R8_9HEXA
MDRHNKKNHFGRLSSAAISVVTLSALLIPVASYFSEDLSSSDAFSPPRDYHHYPTQENDQQEFYHPRDQARIDDDDSGFEPYSQLHQQPYHHPDQEEQQQDLGEQEEHKQEQQYHHHSHQHQHQHHHPHHNHQSHHHHNHHFHHIQQEHKQVVAAAGENSGEQEQQHDGPYYSSHISTNKYGQGHVGNCRLPDSWKGRWFQSGIPNPILIDTRFIEGKGTCYESSGDKFLFVEKKTCHRCVVINARHGNVLEYKETTFCEDKAPLETLCNLIQGDAQLYSLFRIDAQPIDCPFKGPFQFSYNRGHGVCKSPMSRVDVCIEPSKLLLKYQACPDVPRTESTTEELQCLAEWRDGAYHFLVGKLNYQLAASNEDRYRCFIYERTKGHIIKIAESGDATCIGLSSPTEGARTLTFQKIHETGTKCKYPSWLTMHHWYSLDGKLIVRTNHKNSSLSIISEDNKREQYYGVNQNSLGSFSGIHGASTGAYTGGPFGASPVIKDTTHRLFTDGTRIQCQSREDINDDHVAVIAHHTEGCTSTTVCMHLFRRDSHVIELQIREKSTGDFDDYDCGRPEAMGPNLPYVTLISSGENSQRCPHLGKYMTTTITQDGRVISAPAASSSDPCSTIYSQFQGLSSGGSGGSGGGGGGSIGSDASISLTNAHHQGSFHSLVVGCGHRATMDFHSKCLPHEPITSYECHGSWDENGIGFLIASPLSRSSTSASRYCFTYSETDEGLQVFSSSDSCLRDGSPNLEGIWAFNLTIDGQCAEPVTTGGVTRTISCDVGSFTIFLLLSACFLQSSSLWMISSSGWMDQLRVIITTVATSTPYFAKKLVVAPIELLVVALAFSSSTVPYLFASHYHHLLSPPTFPIIRQNQSMLQKQESKASLRCSLSSDSTTCYEGGGRSKTVNEIRM